MAAPQFSPPHSRATSMSCDASLWRLRRHVEICGRLLIAGTAAQPRDFQGPRQPRKAQVLDWAAERLACHHCFMSVVLFAMHRSGGTALSLVMVGGRENVKRLVAEFLDIQIGRELRNLRAIRPALQAL